MQMSMIFLNILSPRLKGCFTKSTNGIHCMKITIVTILVYRFEDWVDFRLFMLLKNNDTGSPIWSKFLSYVNYTQGKLKKFKETAWWAMQPLHKANLGSILYVIPSFVDDNSSASNSYTALYGINILQGKEPSILVNYYLSLNFLGYNLQVLSVWCRI